MKISKAIYPIDQYGAMGKIHSVFKNSFNIEVNQNLINVSSFVDYLPSFGINVSKELFREIKPYIKEGDIVTLKENQITLFNVMTIKKINISEIEIVNLSLKEFNIPVSSYMLLLELLEKEELSKKIGLSLGGSVEPILQSLTTGEVLSEQEWLVVFSKVVGQGKGLTPSGDDIVTGYLSILWLMKDSRADTLVLALERSLNQLSTTVISKAYFKKIIEGYVNSKVYRLFRTLQHYPNRKILQENLLGVLEIGHFSGKDMCFGMLLALLKLRKEVD